MNDGILIYAQYDENKSITAIRSNIFINDLNDWIKIDEWSEGQDRYMYAHADNGEYAQEKHGKPLYDDLGRPNFHDDFVEWTEEEKKEKYPIIDTKPEEPTEKEKQKELLKDMMFEREKLSFLIELPDVEAVKIPLCFDPWVVGKSYKVGDRVEHGGKLWKCRQAHTSQENWKPSIDTASLWEVINVENAGTLEDPIPYDQTMTVYNGKYYLEEGIIYKCIHDSGQPLYATCASLVGNYFEVAEQ